MLIFSNTVDVSVVGFARFSNGLGRVTSGFIDLYKDFYKVNFVDTRFNDNLTISKDLSFDLQKIINNSYVDSYSKVSILTDSVINSSGNCFKLVPNSLIKLAYSMVESTRIPSNWVDPLNNNFDAVIVPDPWLVDVYINSGVEIPVFVLPLGVYLDDFLLKKKEVDIDIKFVFGLSAAASKNKNFELLVDAFSQEFKNCPNVILRMHSMWPFYKSFEDKLKKLNSNNIITSFGELDWLDYIDFMSHIDCYVLLSKGEGFSITPREALALGIPCILSNNTAHKTICDSGFVIPVASENIEISQGEFTGEMSGNCFNCKLEDVRAALRDMYDNYHIHLKNSKNGREWVKQYLYKNLKFKYLNLVKPKKLILGDKNEITDDYLMTSSLELYQKYLSLTD